MVPQRRQTCSSMPDCWPPALPPAPAPAPSFTSTSNVLEQEPHWILAKPAQVGTAGMLPRGTRAGHCAERTPPRSSRSSASRRAWGDRLPGAARRPRNGGGRMRAWCRNHSHSSTPAGGGANRPGRRRWPLPRREGEPAARDGGPGSLSSGPAGRRVRECQAVASCLASHRSYTSTCSEPTESTTVYDTSINICATRGTHHTRATQDGKWQQVQPTIM